jgi:hypothetical protein
VLIPATTAVAAVGAVRAGGVVRLHRPAAAVVALPILRICAAVDTALGLPRAAVRTVVAQLAVAIFRPLPTIVAVAISTPVSTRGGVADAVADGDRPGHWWRGWRQRRIRRRRRRFGRPVMRTISAILAVCPQCAPSFIGPFPAVITVAIRRIRARVVTSRVLAHTAVGAVVAKRADRVQRALSSVVAQTIMGVMAAVCARCQRGRHWWRRRWPRGR